MKRVLRRCLVFAVIVLAPVPIAWTLQDSKPAADSAANVDASLMIHGNGSITVTVDGKEHALAAGEFRTKGPNLLQGKKHVALRMEDWAAFESIATEQLSDLYGLGVRTLTLDIDYQGKKEQRTVKLSPPALHEQILKGATQDRQQALNEVEKLLRSENASDRIKALDTILKIRQLRFDHARFLPLVRKSLDAANERELAAALGAIAVVGGDESDVPRVLQLADSDSLQVRVWISTTLYALNPQGKHPGIGPVIEKLLSDPNNNIRTATYKSLWGLPTTPEVEAKLIEMSHGPTNGGSGEGYDVVYYALSTRPLVRGPVAKRLIELITAPSPLTGRAIWGLSHHAASDDARPIVVDALIRVLETQVDNENRQNAIWGLGFHGGDKAVAKLQAIADDNKESPSLREYARKQLQKSAATDTGASTTPVVPAQKPGELWEQILQPHDGALREQALSQVKELLADPATASEGMQALIRAAKAPFDRQSQVPLIRPYLQSDDPQLRANALASLAVCQSIDAQTLTSFAGDDSPLVRSAVAEMLFVVDPKAESAQTPATVEALLSDSNIDVVRSMIQASWGRPTSVAADEKLVEWSYHSELGKTAVYYGLSTRPLIRANVAQRLIELAETSDRHRGRAVWGLTHQKPDPAAQESVVDALIALVDRLADGADRSHALYGLAQIGNPEGLARLRQLLDSTEETDAVKQYVRGLLGESSTN